jgi:hypothetical protein
MNFAGTLLKNGCLLCPHGAMTGVTVLLLQLWFMLNLGINRLNSHSYVGIWCVLQIIIKQSRTLVDQQDFRAKELSNTILRHTFITRYVTLRYQLHFGKVTEINFSLPKSTHKITINRFIAFFHYNLLQYV